GVGVEGDFGRFKPVVVAPGSFVVSAKSAQFDETNYYNPNFAFTDSFIDRVLPGEVQGYVLFLPENAIDLTITVRAISPDVPLPIYTNPSELPTATNSTLVGTNTYTLSGGTMPSILFYGIGNPTNEAVQFHVTTVYHTTNELGNYFDVLKNVNSDLGPYYRYESGTSMSAAGVSGVLALMEDYFTNTLKLAPSPALMKALLINGARTVNAQYDLEVKHTLNDQGWGLVNLTNSLPMGITNQVAINTKASMFFIDQNPTNALATGDSRTINVSVDPAAGNRPLRVTLVWTDPPGNPTAGIKLVNDLDLIVTNLDNPAEPIVYVGNDIPVGSSFNFAVESNAVPVFDNVNNVENVYLPDPLGTNYSVTVVGHRVNVNAVTAHTNGVVQDYALVISSGNGETNALTLVQDFGNLAFSTTNLTVITNDFGSVTNVSGQLLTGQRVGANSPLLDNNTVALDTNTFWGVGGTNGAIKLGTASQWHFYIMTNTTSFTNTAFGTFQPPTLAIPRMGVTNYDNPDDATRLEADIDVFVSTDPGLLNLDPTAIAGADKSLRRGGSELVVYSNAVPNKVYYIGIHSEDQQAAEYSFFGLFSEEPFSDQNGMVRFVGLPANIPDGTPENPGGVILLGISTQPGTVRRVVLTNELSHENMGDLFGSLSHGQKSAVLNNHSFILNPGTSLPYTNYTYVYEDNDEQDIVGSQHTDGPGSLRNFISEDRFGVWLLTEVDSAPGSTGRVEYASMMLDPEFDENGDALLNVAPNSYAFTSIMVPPEATNMTVLVINESTPTPLPVQLLIKRGSIPTLTDYDYTLLVEPGITNSLTISTNDFPPLQSGRYYIGIYNPNDVTQKIRIRVTLGLSLDEAQTVDFAAFGPQPILDDTVTYSSINVPYDRKIARVDVGLA
ncbi:MAG: S8 family serine peptidase, partial [Verrucomicrobiota bacterium]